MNGLLYYRVGDVVYDIFAAKQGKVKEIRECLVCGLYPCALAPNTCEGCLTVAMQGGLTVQRAPREVFKQSY